MSENTVNVVFDYQINEENEIILRDLNECHKKIEFLESYRNFLLKFSEVCVCGQTSVIKSVVKSLETKYKSIFAKSHGSDGQQSDNNTENYNKTIEQNSEQNNDVIEEFIQRNKVTNERNTTNEETVEQIGDKESETNDNFVFVLNKTNNSIAKKRKDNIDTNVEFVINKFVVKKPEESVAEDVEVTTHSSAEVSTEKTQSSEETTQSLINKNNDIQSSIPALSSQKILLIIPPVPSSESQPKKKKKNPSAQTSINSVRKRKLIKTIPDSLSEEYKENNRIFKSLLNDLKSGKIDSFFDRNYSLIKVSVQNDNKVVFSCAHEGCQFVSDTRHSARRHVQRHNKDKSFVCSVCHKSFVLRAYLSQHMQLVHNIKGKPLLRCEFPDCQFRSISKNQLKSHYWSHSEEKTIKCSQNGCNSYFKSVNQMRSHLKVHKEVREFACDWPECEAKFKSKAYLKRHSETHTGGGVTTSKLKEVLQTGNYSSTVDLNNNMFSVIRQQFVNKSSGKIEIGAQLGFKCNHTDCKFATIFKHLMRQHVSTHLFGKTFGCNLCDKKFGLSKYLTQHKKTVHNVNNSPVICCPVPDCQYKTTYSLGLRIHSLTHQTERPFRCDFDGCSKRFKTEALLRWHKNNRHLKAKPYVCEFVGCHMAFEVRDQLKRHTKCHTKPFQCHFDDCSKSYKKKNDLNRHLREKH